MKQFFVAIFIAVLAAAERPSDPTPPEKYEVLSGDGFNGSGFIVRHDGVFWGVCSLHQFEGKAAECLLTLEADRIELDRSHARKQKDVQVLPVVNPASDLSFLAYEPDFSLSAGDELLIPAPMGGLIEARLTDEHLRGDIYDSSQGPVALQLQAAKPFAAAGGSGGPILLKKSRAVIGVLLTADDPEKSRLVGFETLCLGDAAKNAALHKQRLHEAIRPLVAELLKGTGKPPRGYEMTRVQLRLLYDQMLGSQSTTALRATRLIVGCGGGANNESAELTVMEYTDAASAQLVLSGMAMAYERTPQLPKNRDRVFDDLRRGLLPPIQADATSVVRSRGHREKDGQKQPFTTIVAQATRGCYQIQLLLRDRDMADEELARVVEAALDRVDDVHPIPRSATTAPVAASQPTSSPGTDAPK